MKRLLIVAALVANTMTVAMADNSRPTTVEDGFSSYVFSISFPMTFHLFT